MNGKLPRKRTTSSKLKWAVDICHPANFAAVRRELRQDNPRPTFELRVVDGNQVYFESFAHGKTYTSALADKAKLHPFAKWCVMTQTYDGTTHRSYVERHSRKGEATHIRAARQGRASVGVRINHVNSFNGAVMTARFSPVAMAPADFLKVPASLNASP